MALCMLTVIADVRERIFKGLSMRIGIHTVKILKIKLYVYKYLFIMLILLINLYYRVNILVEL
jgi:hypothetical protein